MGRILVIEDEPGTQQLLRSRLRDLGHDVTVKVTGALGIAEAKASTFDLFLIDMHLGEGVDGIEVCRRMKRDPETRNVPVVLLSGKVRSSADLHRGYEAGCESFMVKDDMSLVDDVIRAMLRIKLLGDELSTQMGLMHQRNEHLQKALKDKARLEDQLARSSDDLQVGHDGGDLPVGLLLVDPEGIVQYADRGAREIFAKRIEGRNLGNLAPGTRLEAFVRDSSTVARTGFRFSVAARGSRPAQKLIASVLPLVPTVVGDGADIRALFLHDEHQHSIERDMLQVAARGVKLEESADLHEIARREYQPNRLMGSSPIVASLRERVLSLANDHNPVLVSGEVGAGKRHLARVLHYSSNRTGAFVPMCYEALGRDRLEAALFGSEDHAALLLQASGGTLFIEGLQKLNQDLQARLVEVLERQVLLDPATQQPRQISVRLVASTDGSIDSGGFLPELRARFTKTIELPPLRDRVEDIPVLACAFLHRHMVGSTSANFTDDAWMALESYEWPGNVAELNSVVRTACVNAGQTLSIDVKALPAPLPGLYQRLIDRGEFTPSARPSSSIAGTHQPALHDAALDETRGFLEDVIASLPEGADGEDTVSFEFFEKWALKLALSRSEGNRLKAAELLSVGKSTMYRKLHKYELH